VPEVVKSNTQYNILSDELTFVCGPGGGLEAVVDEDFNSAVARRQALSKTFA
jgi:hypothetical protein